MKIIPNTKIRIGTKFSYLGNLHRYWIIESQNGNYWMARNDGGVFDVFNIKVLAEHIKSGRRKIIR